MLGEIISVSKTGYQVALKGETVFCLINNSYTSDTPPIVNDKVVIEQREDKFFILEIKPRKNILSRYDETKDRHQYFAANIDIVFIVTSANREFSIDRIKRFIALAETQSIKSIVILTKTDQSDRTYYQNILESEKIEYIGINATNKTDVEKLFAFWKSGETAILIGSSGVGKSTLINSLTGLDLRTQEIQSARRLNQGRHTTSARTLYFLPCGRKIIDNPGIKIVQLSQAE